MKTMQLSLTLVTALLLPTHHLAADNNGKDYSMCAVVGFYEGDNNRFLTDLAERVTAKNNLFGDAACTAAIKEGRAVGERFAKPEAERRAGDYEIIRNAQHFSNLIYDSILFRVKL